MARWVPTEPPPTIGHFRSIGLKALNVHCLGYPCTHVGWKTFDELRLKDDAVYIHLERTLRFACTRCGGRRTRTTLDWRDHRTRGVGRGATVAPVDSSKAAT